MGILWWSYTSCKEILSNKKNFMYYRSSYHCIKLAKFVPSVVMVTLIIILKFIRQKINLKILNWLDYLRIHTAMKLVQNFQCYWTCMSCPSCWLPIGTGYWWLPGAWLPPHRRWLGHAVEQPPDVTGLLHYWDWVHQVFQCSSLIQTVAHNILII